MRNDVRAFIAGHKPSVLIESDFEEGFITLTVRAYPCLDMGNGYWFFQDNDSLSWAQSNLARQKDENARRSLTGLLLGQPPTAVQNFVNGRNCDIKVNYSGIEFQTTYDTIVDDITWLWNVRPVGADFEFYLDILVEDGNEYYYSTNDPSLDKIVRFLQSIEVEKEVLV